MIPRVRELFTDERDLYMADDHIVLRMETGTNRVSPVATFEEGTREFAARGGWVYASQGESLVRAHK